MKQPDAPEHLRPLGSWLAGLIVFVILARSSLHAAETATVGHSLGIRWDGGAGTAETISAIMAREESSPLQTSSSPRSSRPKLTRGRKALPPQTQTLGKSTAAASPSGVLRTAAVSTPLPNPLTVGVSFLGAQSSDSAVNPPDSMGDAGPTQFLVCVNGRIRLFDKTGVMDIERDAKKFLRFGYIRRRFRSTSTLRPSDAALVCDHNRHASVQS